jgi:hypothetical protein
VHVTEKIFGDLINGDIVNIKLIPFNEEQQQIKRPFEQGQLYFEIFL